MIQNWKKKGLIFAPDSSKVWSASHAQLPTIDYIKGERTCRVYYASRTKEQRSHIGWFDFDLDSLKVTKRAIEPVMAPGPIGFFDQHGVYPSSIINYGGKKYLYYIGWTQGVKAPLFYANIGLAISEDNGQTFHRHSPAPIMQRSEFDPCLVTSPFVFMDAKNQWKMTYVSGVKWFERNNEYHSVYNVKMASSKNGIDWIRKGKVAIDFEYQDENNIARACVLQDKNIFRSWYCYIKPPYKYQIGYAKSKDSEKWIRQDNEIKFQNCSDDFDNEMMCYPAVLYYKNRYYMFYNGNAFGKEGIGLAIWNPEQG